MSKYQEIAILKKYIIQVDGDRCAEECKFFHKGHCDLFDIILEGSIRCDDCKKASEFCIKLFKRGDSIDDISQTFHIPIKIIEENIRNKLNEGE